MTPTTETPHLPGLPTEAGIILDHRGMPLIRDETREAAFVAQLIGAGEPAVPGGSGRLVLGVGDRDRSFAINHPGQPGDPDCPHCRDMRPLWARDQSVPLPFTHAAVDAAAADRLRLRPVAA